MSEYLRQLDSLNPQQREALNESGHVAVLAGPGSGKTKTLVLKIARLLDEVPKPRGVACLTYGQEAAREFEGRLRQLGIRPGGRLFTGTVHSFCLSRVLRPFGHRLPRQTRYLSEFEIATDVERRKAREAGLLAANIQEPEYFWAAKLDEFRRLVMVEPTRASDSRFDDRLPRCAEVYASALHGARRIDFDDIVAGSLQLIEQDAYVRQFLTSKYPRFVIDEYQDLGLALHRMVIALADRAGAVMFVVGDPDQSIYGFGGARPEFLEEFSSRRDVKTVRLEMNYRCGQRIIDASLHALQPAEGRNFRSSGTKAGEIFFHLCKRGLAEQAATAGQRIQELIESGVPPNELGVLASRWDDLGPFEDELKGRRIQYRMQRSALYKQTPLTTWIEDVARWCAGGWRTGTPRLSDLFQRRKAFMSRLNRDSGSREDLLQLTELFTALVARRAPNITMGEWLPSLFEAVDLADVIRAKKGVPLQLRHDVQELRTLAEAFANAPHSTQPLAEFAGISESKVVLQTLYGSKGLQYTAVFLPALERGVLPKYKGDEAEARRLFYVGITRARDEVHLLCSGFYLSGKKKNEFGVSPFVEELWKRLHSSAS